MNHGDEWGLNHIAEQDIIKIIKLLKNKNSSGYNCLTN